MKQAKPKTLQLNLKNDSHYSFRVKDVTKEYYKKLWTPPENNDADTILNWLYNRGLVLNYIRKLEYDTIDDDTILDMTQEVWVYLIEKKDKLKELYDTLGITGLTAYVSGIIARLVHSSTSTLYIKYKRDYKRFMHLSDLCWSDYYNTGKMLPIKTDYLTSETNDDLLNKYIETNQNDKLYE